MGMDRRSGQRECYSGELRVSSQGDEQEGRVSRVQRSSPAKERREEDERLSIARV
jgi:hypothetical protein